jgi:2-methylcitrate dehydratase
MADHPTVRAHQQDADRMNPRSREAADHSFNFLIAVALIDGAFGFGQFEIQRWNDPKVRALMERMTFATDPDLSARAPLSYPCAIEAKGKDGKVARSEVLFPPGFSRGGIDADVVASKFRAVTAGHLDTAACARLIDHVMRLDKSGSRVDLFGVAAAE